MRAILVQELKTAIYTCKCDSSKLGMCTLQYEQIISPSKRAGELPTLGLKCFTSSNFQYKLKVGAQSMTAECRAG